MNLASQQLLQKARENLRAAELLRREGFCDICASRCYYAVFYAAEALLWSKSLAFSSHGAVSGAFGREFARTGLVDRKFHRYLLEAFQTRQDSDYESVAGITETQAAHSLREATEFIEMAERFLQGPSGTQSS